MNTSPMAACTIPGIAMEEEVVAFMEASTVAWTVNAEEEWGAVEAALSATSLCCSALCGMVTARPSLPLLVSLVLPMWVCMTVNLLVLLASSTHSHAVQATFLLDQAVRLVWPVLLVAAPTQITRLQRALYALRVPMLLLLPLLHVYLVLQVHSVLALD